MCQLVKNLLNLMRKRGGKSGGLINKKALKLDEELKKKTDHLLLYKR